MQLAQCPLDCGGSSYRLPPALHTETVQGPERRQLLLSQSKAGFAAIKFQGEAEEAAETVPQPVQPAHPAIPYFNG